VQTAGGHVSGDCDESAPVRSEAPVGGEVGSRCLTGDDP
jgi:hypothetical protein